MKKTTLLIALFSILFLHLNAQLSEDFEGAFPPAGWLVADDESGMTIDWESSSDSFSGTKAAFIDYDGTENTEDWLISPVFTPDASNNKLTFYQKQDDPNVDWGSTYTVRVSTTGVNLSDFTVIIDTQTETDFNEKYSLKEIDLSAYNGMPIYIAFVMEQFNGDSWYIDKLSTTNPTSVAPDCATNYLPIDTATDITNLAGEVNLSWEAPISGAIPSSYDVYLGLASNSLSLIAETASTNYTVVGVSYATTYYWKIVPKNYTVDATSCIVQSFTTQIEDTAPPANDSCATAITISSTPYENIQDASHATNNGPDPGGFVWECDGGSPTGGMNDGVWYTFTTITGGTVNIDITNVSSFFDVEVAVYSGVCGNLICVDNKDTAATGAGASESLSVVLANATKYWINIGSNSASMDDPEGAFKIAISLEAGVILGIDDLESKLNASLYPNPTDGILNLKLKNSIDEVHVFNLMGQKVESVFPNRNNSQIDISNLPIGMYIVEIQSKGKKGSYRVIKQ